MLQKCAHRKHCSRKLENPITSYNLKKISVPNGCQQFTKETRTWTKNYTMTRTTDNTYYFTKDFSEAGLDGPQVSRAIEQTNRTNNQRLAGRNTRIIFGSTSEHPRWYIRGHEEETSSKNQLTDIWCMTTSCYTPTQQDWQNAVHTFTIQPIREFCRTQNRRNIERPVWKWSAPNYRSSSLCSARQITSPRLLISDC